MDYSRTDFRSYSKELISASTKVTDLPIGSKIVHVDIVQSGTASNSWLECGGMPIAYNYAKDVDIDLAFTSTTTCTIHKTGNDNSFFAIVYSSGYPTTTATYNFSGVDNGTFALFGGLLLFMLALFFTKDRFKVDRYE